MTELFVDTTGPTMDHHDDPHLPYRFGLLPEPLTAPPPGGWKINVLMAIAAGSMPLDRICPTDPAPERAMVAGERYEDFHA
jgi:hypothetical protein